LPNENVSRTGYNEVDLTDNKVKNAKVDFSLHFKPCLKMILKLFGKVNLDLEIQFIKELTDII
jgi:hypothetical protein